MRKNLRKTFEFARSFFSFAEQLFIFYVGWNRVEKSTVEKLKIIPKTFGHEES